jgi:hypothetical protein
MKISLTIDRFESDKAILRGTDGETVVWPKNKLPEEFKEGRSLLFDISADNQTTLNRQTDAKDILNEILDIKN